MGSSVTTSFCVSVEPTIPYRLDLWLQEQFRTHSRSFFQRLISHNQVTINGLTPKKRQSVAKGDLISIAFPPQELALLPDKTPLSILYEDAAILVINKPAGLIVHPSAATKEPTLVHRLLGYLDSLPEGSDPSRPGIVHRLDKGTSGVMVVAKTPQAQKFLIQAFHDHKVQKTYIALCHNAPQFLLCNQAICRHPTHRDRMAITETGGKSALTTFQILGKNEKYSLVQAHPKTGRTHQIRVHLQHLKAPIVGDPTYGAPKKPCPHPLLHAQRLTLPHPETGDLLTFTAPIPANFSQEVKNAFTLAEYRQLRYNE